MLRRPACQSLSWTSLQIIGEPPRPELHKRKAPAGFDTALKHALVEEAAHMFDLEHDPVMVGHLTAVAP